MLLAELVNTKENITDQIIYFYLNHDNIPLKYQLDDFFLYIYYRKRDLRRDFSPAFHLISWNLGEQLQKHNIHKFRNLKFSNSEVYHGRICLNILSSTKIISWTFSSWFSFQHSWNGSLKTPSPSVIWNFARFLLQIKLLIWKFKFQEE